MVIISVSILTMIFSLSILMVILNSSVSMVIISIFVFRYLTHCFSYIQSYIVMEDGIFYCYERGYAFIVDSFHC